jgi:hypothetical protein
LLGDLQGPPLRSRRTPKACAIWNTAPHPDNPAAPDVNGVATLRSSFHTVLGQRRSDEVAQIRYDIRGRDGQFVERYWLPVTCPVLDDRTGEVMYLLYNPTEATERMKQE